MSLILIAAYCASSLWAFTELNAKRPHRFRSIAAVWLMIILAVITGGVITGD